jgi:hypothetical protein
MPTGLFLLALPDDEQHRAMLQEGGLLEMSTAALYFVAAAVLLPVVTRFWPYCVILLAFGFRELDLDKLLFTEGLFKSRQYVGGDVDAVERGISAAVLLSLALAGLTGLRRAVQNLPRRLREADGVALCILLGVLLLVTAKQADGLGRKLSDAGIAISQKVDLHVLAYEEFGEAVAALSFLIAAAVFVATWRRSDDLGLIARRTQ